MLSCSERMGYAGMGKSAIKVLTRGGFETGFKIIVCRACLDPPCARVCPEAALRPRHGGGVILEPRRCTGCGHCAAACDIGAVTMDPDTGKPIICVYCGYCAPFCPHKVIALEELT